MSHTDQAKVGAKLACHASPETVCPVANGLAALLADTYTLGLKTQNYHWNVTGPHFTSLHQMFEAQYAELSLAADEIAERIRALGVRAPASYGEFARRTVIQDDSDHPDGTEMVRRLLAAQGSVIHTAKTIYSLAEEARDEPTADLLTKRVQAHEKAAWMLRSQLD